jgi:hypothetical protein
LIFCINRLSFFFLFSHLFISSSSKTESKNNFRKMAPLQVIGAGYGRTGTDSLREALNILG